MILVKRRCISPLRRPAAMPPRTPHFCPRRSEGEARHLVERLDRILTASAEELQALSGNFTETSLLTIHRNLNLEMPRVATWLDATLTRIETLLKPKPSETPTETLRELVSATSILGAIGSFVSDERYDFVSQAQGLPLGLLLRCRGAYMRVIAYQEAPFHLRGKDEQGHLHAARRRLVETAANLALLGLPSLQRKAWHPAEILSFKEADLVFAFAAHFEKDRDCCPLDQRENFLGELRTHWLTAPGEFVASMTARINQRGDSGPTKDLWRQGYHRAVLNILRHLAILCLHEDPRALALVDENRRLLTSPIGYGLGGFVPTMIAATSRDLVREYLLYRLTPWRAALLRDVLPLAFSSIDHGMSQVSNENALKGVAAQVMRAFPPLATAKSNPILLADSAFDGLIAYIVADLLQHDPRFRVPGYANPNPTFLSGGVVTDEMLATLRRLSDHRKISTGHLIFRQASRDIIAPQIELEINAKIGLIFDDARLIYLPGPSPDPE